MIFEPIKRQGRPANPETTKARRAVHSAVLKTSGPITEKHIARATKQRRYLVKWELRRLANYGILSVVDSEPQRRGRPLNVYWRA